MIQAQLGQDSKIIQFKLRRFLSNTSSSMFQQDEFLQVLFMGAKTLSIASLRGASVHFLQSESRISIILQVILTEITQFKSLFMDIQDVGDSSVELFGLPTFYPPVYFLAAAQKIKRPCVAFFFVSIPILLTCLKALYETLLVLHGGAEPETMPLLLAPQELTMRR